ADPGAKSDRRDANTAVRHLYSALRGVPGEFVSSALERCRGAHNHWPVRARAGGARARSPRDLRQILAVQPAYRPEAADPALAVRHRGREALAIRMLTPLPPTSQGRVPAYRTGAGAGLGPLGGRDRCNRSCLVR